MAPELLDPERVDAALRHLGGWSLRGDRIVREFEFGDFRAAFGFLTQVALLAERLDHHPEMFNSYRRVELRSTTHSAGGLTQRDFELAREIDRIFDE